MANLKLVVFSKKAKENGECRVYVQLTHKGKVTWIKTIVCVRPEYFDGGRINPRKDPNAGLKNIAISGDMSKYERKLLDIGDKADYMNIETLCNFLKSKSDVLCETDFFRFSEKRIAELKEIGRFGTATPLQNAVNRFRDFLKTKKQYAIDFNDISTSLLEKFIYHYQQAGHKKNSIANYLTYIRSMFNAAICEYNNNPAQPVIFNYPFKKIKIEREITVNRNLSVDIVRKIRDLKPESQTMEFAIDVFILQMYLFGINLKDLFYLKLENVVNGRLQFNRHKTDRFYNIKIEPEAAEIIEKYKGKKYLLWFADNCYQCREKGQKPHSRKSELQWGNSQNWLKMINTQLHKVEKILDLNLVCPLTSYFSRHSFATIMREIGISRDDISLCLGHKSPEQNMKISGIYINEDYEKADVANRKLINYLNEK
ncbi:tyrosine recombinase [Bacteroidia bacterium]|nr:tyrosine recombinase [Bacteroidia bacterium]